METVKNFLIENRVRAVAFILITALMICSVTCIAQALTDPQTYKATIESIDDKKLTVLGVSAATAGSATAMSALAKEAAQPVADKLMDLSTYLLIVICVLVLEKSLLTVFGAISCYILLPLACAFSLAYIVVNKKALVSWAIKLAILALALVMIVPASMKISDYIYEINQISFEQTTETVEQSAESESEAVPQEDNRPWYIRAWDSVTNAVDAAITAIDESIEKAIAEG